MELDYTTRARGITYKYPLLTNIGIQINFWIIAYLFFFVLVYFLSKAITSLYPVDVEIDMLENILIGVLGAIIFGTILGLVDYFVEPRLRGRSLGIEITIKGVLYLAAWFLMTSVTFAIGSSMEALFIISPELTYTDLFPENMFQVSSIYTAVAIAIISFIKQISNKFGPGVLIPMLLGKFRKPSVEERIFLFMDLKDSTTYAEKLGHLKFSEMIQDCFLDVNKIIPPFNAEIYQYVGDEVVLSWSGAEGLHNMNCIKFFFAFQEQLQGRKERYELKYGFVPQFKAGANFGNITVAEVGDIKREIAYHGDTINTASRIQAVCNTYGKSFIISENLKDQIEWGGSFEAELLDSIKLKGKEKEVKLYSVNSRNLSL